MCMYLHRPIYVAGSHTRSQDSGTHVGHIRILQTQKNANPKYRDPLPYADGTLDGGLMLEVPRGDVYKIRGYRGQGRERGRKWEKGLLGV